MTAFGGIFRAPHIEGEDEDGENGERGSIAGLDLDSGVVRLHRTRSAPADPPADDDPQGRPST